VQDVTIAPALGSLPAMHIRSILLAAAAAGLFAACNRTEDKTVSSPPATPPGNLAKAPSADDGVVPVAKPTQTPGATGVKQGPPRPQNPDMDTAVKELMARPEMVTGNQMIKVEHVLIAFAGAERSTAKRTKDEAQALAKKVYAEAVGGADFEKLMKQSDDPGGGNYEIDHQTNFVQGFKDVAFRLDVGEIGVAPFDQTKSYFGWHVIKRIR
jgi:hypothetical protein